jgi:hypothetical protein
VKTGWNTKKELEMNGIRIACDTNKKCIFACLIKKHKNMEAVVLNTNTALDLRLITALARELSIDMFSISQEEQEEMEDLKLLSFMQKSCKEELADNKETLSKLCTD